MRVRGSVDSTPLGSGVNYWVWDYDGGVRGMACAFTSQFLDAEPLRGDVVVAPDDPLAAFQPVELLWAGYMPRSTFNISSPYDLGSSSTLSRHTRETTYLDFLGEIGYGAIVVRADGRTAYVNETARRFAGDGMLLLNGRVDAQSPADRSALRRAIASALSDGIGVAPPFGVSRPSGKMPLLVQVSRIAVEETGMTAEPSALLLVTDPLHVGRNDAMHSLQVLGLTPAEARIATLVGTGLSPREAAGIAGNTEATVRSTLKQVYGKLDISRQSELAVLVARIAATGGERRTAVDV
jgi:DNA-binding CsgD family transcriptional regulator